MNSYLNILLFELFFFVAFFYFKMKRNMFLKHENSLLFMLISTTDVLLSRENEFRVTRYNLMCLIAFCVFVLLGSSIVLEFESSDLYRGFHNICLCGSMYMMYMCGELQGYVGYAIKQAFHIKKGKEEDREAKIRQKEEEREMEQRELEKESYEREFDEYDDEEERERRKRDMEKRDREDKEREREREEAREKRKERTRDEYSYFTNPEERQLEQKLLSEIATSILFSVILMIMSCRFTTVESVLTSTNLYQRVFAKYL